jgi:hypothetical protein
VFGPAYAASDECSLRMGHARVAEAAWPTVDPVTRDLCEGFALGVNAFLVDRPDKAPAWADGVQPKDILALWHAFLMSFAPLDLPGVYRNAGHGDGQLLGPRPFRNRGEQDHPRHQPHHHFEGLFNGLMPSGAGRPGMCTARPFGGSVVVQGFNGSLGWGLTPNFPDFADVYDEQSAPAGDPENPRDPRVSEEAPVSPEALMLLEYMAAAQPYYVRTENGLEERYVPAAASPRGPILEGGRAAVLLEDRGIRAHWRHPPAGGDGARPENAAQFQAALGMAQLPCFTWSARTARGNLFYLYNTLTGCARRFPPRFSQMGVGAAYDRPLPVGVDLLGWGELVAPDALPSILNPPSGWIQASGAALGCRSRPAFGPQSWPVWLARDPNPTGDGGFRSCWARAPAVSGQQIHALRHRGARRHGRRPLLLGGGEKRPDLVQSAHPDLAAALDLLRGGTSRPTPARPA